MTTIVVTGATGNVGSELLTLLDPNRHRVRAFVRQVPAQPLRGIDYRVGDFADAASLDETLAGADALFLACSNSPRQVEFETRVLDRAARHGIPRVVKLSAFGAADDAPVELWRWHAEIEHRLQAAGMSHTVLRPFFFMSNLLANLGTAATLGMVFAPAGEARIGMIDPRDVAAVAARMLTATGDAPTMLTLAGPDILTYHDVAAELGQLLGRPVGYQDVSEDAAREHMLSSGLPAFAVDQILAVYACLRGGVQARSVDDSVHRITGHSPRSLADYLRDCAAPAGLLDTASLGDVRS